MRSAYVTNSPNDGFAKAMKVVEWLSQIWLTGFLCYIAWGLGQSFANVFVGP